MRYLKGMGALAIALLLLAAPLEGSPVNNPPVFAGVYAGEQNDRTLRLSLRVDGTALWHEAEKTKDAKWTATKARLTVTFTGGAPPIVWTADGVTLTPVEWDHTVWGSDGPPRLKKLTGGTKHIPEKPIRQ